MSLTAIPQQPFGQPPRVRIDVGTGDPSKPFTSLTILRDGKPIREQPYVGGSDVVAFDYEAPFGVPVTYSAVGEVATLTALLTETWSSLSGWTTLSGTPSVSGSHFSGGSSGAAVRRDLTFPAYGYLGSQGLVKEPVSGISQMRFGPLLVVSSGTSRAAYGGGVGDFVMVGSLAVPFTVSWTPETATVTTTSGTHVLPRRGGTFADTISAQTQNNGDFVEDFTVSGVVPTPFTASTTVTPVFQGSWLIHPTQPALSCQIDAGPLDGDRSLRFIEASSGESKSSQAQSTIHRPVGRRRAVVITSGPRQADEWTLVLGAPTIEQKNAIRSLVDDQTPLLLRSPVDVLMDLPDDWYSVGDVTVARVEVPAITQETVITLPLIPVDEPIVRQGALWTYGSDLLANPTYADSRAEFSTYLDRLAGAS